METITLVDVLRVETGMTDTLTDLIGTEAQQLISTAVPRAELASYLRNLPTCAMSSPRSCGTQWAIIRLDKCRLALPL